MKIANELKLEMENFTKASLHIDTDCPLGQLYDFSCALQHFFLQKMNELKQQQEIAQKQQPPQEVSDVQPSI